MRYINRPEEGMQDAQAALNRTHKYNCFEVKDYLRNTYQGICAYCECEVEVSNFLEVEHFHPKSQYKGLETDIHNLHLSCKRCNNPKGSKTDLILSPNFYKKVPDDKESEWVVTNEKELSGKIRYCGHMLYSPLDEDITKDTISILRLNNEQKTDKREMLIESRLQVYDQAYSLFVIAINGITSLATEYKEIVSFCVDNKGDNPLILESIYCRRYHDVIDKTLGESSSQLIEMMKHGHPYSQMIIDNFGEPLRLLLSITQRLDWKVSFNNQIMEELDTVISFLNRIKAKIDESRDCSLTHTIIEA